MCRLAWCHTALSPTAHRVSAPGTAINIWRGINETGQQLVVLLFVTFLLNLIKYFKGNKYICYWTNIEPMFIQNVKEGQPWNFIDSSEMYLCAISRSSFVRTLASDVIPATLQAMSLKDNKRPHHNVRISEVFIFVYWESFCSTVHSLIELVDLLREKDLIQQLVDVTSLCC